MNNSKSVAVSYEVCVCEISFSGIQGAPLRTPFSGRGARRRALQFAELEKRSRTTSIKVYPTSGKRRNSISEYRNERPTCPCNDPRCKSIYAAGKIVHLYSEQRAHEAVGHRPTALTPCTPLEGCAGWYLGERCERKSKFVVIDLSRKLHAAG